MRHRIILIILAITTLAIPSFGESTPQSSETAKIFTLNECIATALENNLGLKSNSYMVESSILENRAAQAPFDPTFSWNIYDAVTRRGGISLESQIAGGSESKILASDFELSEQLFSGGKWSLKYETTRNESQSFLAEGDLTTYESKTTLSYSHPLLEGGDSKINRSGIRLAQLNSEKDKAERDNLTRELVYQVTTSFFDTLKARHGVDVAELSLKEAESLRDTAKARFDAGHAAAYEVMASESGLASREEALLISNTLLQNSRDALKNLMGINLTENAEFTGKLEINKTEPPDFDRAFETAKQYRPDLVSLMYAKSLAEVEYSSRKDRVKHMLALIGSVGLQGEDTNWGNAIGDMSNLSWYLGLNYSMPLGGNKEAVTRFKQAELNLQSINISIEDKLRNISLEITQAIRNLDTAKQRVDVTLKGVNLQEEKLKMEKARLELGLITSSDLLDYEEDLASARLRYIEARADYLKAVSYLEYVTAYKWNK